MSKTMGYNVETALWEVQHGDDSLRARASAWIRQRVDALESQQPSQAELEKVVSYVERVLRAANAYQRCSVNVPKPCVRPADHDGWHISNSGTTWPPTGSTVQVESSRDYHFSQNKMELRARLDDREVYATVDPADSPQKLTEAMASLAEQLDVPVGVLRPPVDQPRTAPVHQVGRLPEPPEKTCTAPHLVDGEPRCALVQWHDGPHMDLVAVSHAGKAGEVWE